MKMKSEVDKKFLDMLCCPVCKGEIVYDDNGVLFCKSCFKEYLYKEGIFVLLE